MRKTYIKPSIYSRKVVISRILAGSEPMNSNLGTDSQDAKRGSGFDWDTPAGDDIEESEN